MEEKSIIINDLTVFYTTGGTGPVLLMLHGWGSNQGAFIHLQKELAASHTLICPDLPGFGRSEEPDEPCYIDCYADFLLAFLSALKINKLSMLGHSFGGSVIIKLCCRQKASVDIQKIILVGSAGIRPKQGFIRNVKSRFFKLSKAVFGTRLMAYLYPTYLGNLRQKVGSKDYLSATPVMRDTLVRTVNEDLTDIIPRISQPTLLIWGKNDMATPLAYGKKMHELISDSRLLVLEGAGHYPFIDQPDRVVLEINAFMKEAT